MAVGIRNRYLSVVPFVPLIGDSCCGSNTGVERRFFGGYRRFFAPVKEMGVHYYKEIPPGKLILNIMGGNHPPGFHFVV